MKLVHEEILIDENLTVSQRQLVERVRQDIRRAISEIHHPPGSGAFTIYGQSGKRRGEGNGVVPIKKEFAARLSALTDWLPEQAIDFGVSSSRPGKVDVCLRSPTGTCCVEWETGNISSSHRSLNKLCLGLLKGSILFGSLIVPSRSLYAFLTDRVGNYQELVPYLPLWRSIKPSSGFLNVFVIEHDEVSDTVAQIPKGTDGRALF
jgi:hypothetical protein